MGNQRGGIKLITLIIGVIFFIIILLVIFTLRNIVLRDQGVSKGNSNVMDKYTEKNTVYQNILY